MNPREQRGIPHEIRTQSQHPLREREILRILQRALGGGTIIGITFVTILLWFLFRPTGQPTSRYLGEMLGTIAILLFSCSLVLATKAPFFVSFFVGLDRMYLCHRCGTLVGVWLSFRHYVRFTSVPSTVRHGFVN